MSIDLKRFLIERDWIASVTLQLYSFDGHLFSSLGLELVKVCLHMHQGVGSHRCH